MAREMTPAYPLALLCRDAYTAPPDIKVGGIVRALSRPSTAGRVIAFQGTQDIDQALADLDIGPEHIIGLGDMHEGIWRATKSASTLCDKALGDEPGILTGHSLGGALALALGAHRCLRGRPPLAIITFGAPRVGVGPALRLLFEQHGVDVRLYRHGADPIPYLPPCIEAFADWEHPADLIQIGERGEFPEIADHAIAGYVAALSAI